MHTPAAKGKRKAPASLLGPGHEAAEALLAGLSDGKVQKAVRLAAAAGDAPPELRGELQAKLLKRVRKWAKAAAEGGGGDDDADGEAVTPAAPPRPTPAKAATPAPSPRPAGTPVTPWVAAVARRGAGPQPARALAGAINPSDPAEVARRAERESRFAAEMANAGPAKRGPTLQALAASGAAAPRGTSTALEKRYLRLTAAPAAAAIRPPAVLRDALALVKRRWAQAPDYEHACEQLKAIRQDVTVQHLRDALAVDAYETHARIALEVRDAAEYTQCAAVLRRLHAQPGAPGSPAEFAAYRLLAAAALGQGAYATELRTLRRADAEHAFVVHARAAVAAAHAGHACAFFRLYATAPRMAPYLMDAMAPRVRVQGLAAALAAYRPGVPAAWLAAQLGFEDGRQLAEWARQSGAAVVLPDAATGEDMLCAPARALQPAHQPAPAAPPPQQQPFKKAKKRTQ